MGMANVDGKDYIVDKVGRVNRDIEWEDGAACYANGFHHIASGVLDDDLLSHYLTFGDFQLNEPRIGDYIPKSELDTEQKYNDAVGELGLFGFVATHYCRSVNFHDENSEVIFLGGGMVNGGKFVDEQCKRKITYNQLMAIGKLKRLMDERDKVNTSEKPNSCDKPKLATQYLNECIDVQKQRGEQYDSTGTGGRSFAAAASAFNAITGKNLKGSDVCLLLTCVKAVRQYSNPDRLHEDSLLDGVSYLSLWAEELNKEIK